MAENAPESKEILIISLMQILRCAWYGTGILPTFWGQRTTGDGGNLEVLHDDRVIEHYALGILH
jgi:hypothetical protein